MKLSDTEFTKLARSHKTGDDHLKLAEHFAAHARNMRTTPRSMRNWRAIRNERAQACGEARHYAGIRVRPPRPCEVWRKSIGACRNTVTRSRVATQKLRLKCSAQNPGGATMSKARAETVAELAAAAPAADHPGGAAIATKR